MYIKKIQNKNIKMKADKLENSGIADCISRTSEKIKNLK